MWPSPRRTHRRRITFENNTSQAAATERQVSDGGDAIGDCDAGQTGAILLSPTVPVPLRAELLPLDNFSIFRYVTSY